MIEQGRVVEGDIARADAGRELAAQGVAIARVAEEGGEARALGVGLWAGEGELAPDLGEDVDGDARLEAMVAAEGRGELALEVVDGRVEELEGVGFAGRHSGLPSGDEIEEVEEGLFDAAADGDGLDGSAAALEVAEAFLHAHEG